MEGLTSGGVRSGNLGTEGDLSGSCPHVVSAIFYG